MRNRAKCKVCDDIIESFHSEDYVLCSCGLIGVYGGQSMNCTAKDWEHFVRIDDNDNEVPITVVDKSTASSQSETSPEHAHAQNKPNKKEIIILIDEMIAGIERLPPAAMYQPVTHADHLSLLFVLSAFFKTDS